MKGRTAMLHTGLLAALGLVTYALRHQSLDLPAAYWAAIVLAAGLYGVLARAIPAQSASLPARSVRQLGLLAVVTLSLLTAAYYLKVSDTYSRLWSGLWLAAGWLGLTLAEALAPKSRRRRILVAGPAELTAPLAESIRAFATMTLAEAVEWLRAGQQACRDVDEMVIVGELPNEQERAALVLALHGHPVSVRYCLDGAALAAMAGGNGMTGLPTIPLLSTPSPLQDLLKRAEDVVLGVAALALALPLMAAIALAIRLESPGPVLFRQRRLGMGGRSFTIYKFRTMSASAKDDADAPPVRDGDRRVTRVGSVLRRCGLDELPQLVNVLRGDMSLVGPRPHALPHDMEWSNTVSGYALRLQVRPGITGLAQVRGYRGGIHDQRAIEQRVALDLEYIRSWSLLLDLDILARTIPAMLRPDRS